MHEALEAITYDDAGRRTGLTYPNGVQTSYTYDDAGRLVSTSYIHNGTELESLDYGYDASGNRTSVERQGIKSLLPSSSESSFDAANEMLTFSGDSLTYDDNGNLASVIASCGTTSYTWDARDRLTNISGYDKDCNTLSASFTYDALGRRIEKTINGVTTRYLYDGLDIVQEMDSGGTPTVFYIRTLMIDEPLARIDSGGTIRYYHADALGSVIALTDENATVKTQYNYSPFGLTEEIGEDSDNPFQFTGRENDGATGLYFYRARYYSPTLGRFITEDPIGYAAGDTNFYAYAGNRVMNMVDPLGLYFWSGEIEYGSGGYYAGAGHYWITLTTYHGTKKIVAKYEIEAYGFTYGSPWGTGKSKFSLNDHYWSPSGPDPSKMAGRSLLVSLTGAFKKGYGIGFLKMGYGTAFMNGETEAFDFSANAFLGKAVLIKCYTEDNSVSNIVDKW